MAYPFSDSTAAPFTPELDLSSLGSFGGLGAGSTASNSLGMASGPAAATQTAGAMSIFDSIFNKESMFGGASPSGAQTGGWVMPAVNILGGIFSMNQGKKAEAFAKDQLKEQRRQFDMNYGAQKQSINTELEDRQRARVASAGGSGAYESVDSYLDKNRIK